MGAEIWEFLCSFFVLWWSGVIAGVFGGFWVLDVVNFWWLRGKVRGEGGQEAITFPAAKFSHFFEIFFAWEEW
jgi:hypothetical protein